MTYTFSKVIASYLREKKITEAILAQMLKVKEIDVKSWVKGANFPQYGERLRILKAIQCPVVVEDKDGFIYQTTMKKEYNNVENRLEYYASDMWKEKSQKRFKIDKYTCQLCGYEDKTKTGKGLVAHHIKYDISYGGRESEEIALITLCNECHNKVHNDKASCRKATKEFKGGRKILLLPKVDGSVKKFIFTDDCLDKDIMKYIEKIEKECKVQYKYKTIVKIGDEESGVINSGKLKLLLNKR